MCDFGLDHERSGRTGRWKHFFLDLRGKEGCHEIIAGKVEMDVVVKLFGSGHAAAGVKRQFLLGIHQHERRC